MAKRRRSSSGSGIISALIVAVVALVGLIVKGCIALLKLLWRGAVALWQLLVTGVRALWGVKLTLPIRAGVPTNAVVVILIALSTLCAGSLVVNAGISAMRSAGILPTLTPVPTATITPTRLPTHTPKPTPTHWATQTPRPTAAKAPTRTPQPPAATATAKPFAPTATPGSTATAKNCWGITFVADVTIPDGTQINPGAKFVKTWRVRNSGTCDWENVSLTLLNGESLDGQPIAIPPTASGATAEISINMVAPQTPGNYRGAWSLKTEDNNFGELTVVIVSGNPVVARPTIAATEVAAQPTATSPASAPPPQPTQRTCCKYCNPAKSKPCGDSCIGLNKTCNVGEGCACAGQ